MRFNRWAALDELGIVQAAGPLHDLISREHEFAHAGHQLIEQGDIDPDRALRGRRGAALELVAFVAAFGLVGRFVGAASFGFGFSRRARHGGRLGRAPGFDGPRGFDGASRRRLNWVGLAFGKGQKLPGERLDIELAVGAGRVDHAQSLATLVGRGQEHSHQVRSWREPPVAHLAEHVFSGVRQLFESLEAQETGAAFHGVHHAKHAAHEARRLGLLLEGQEIAIH